MEDAVFLFARLRPFAMMRLLLCGPLAIAACLRPERPEYRAYRDRAREAASRS